MAKVHPTGGERPPPSVHPTVELLVAYAGRELMRRPSGAVQEHLACCAECSALVLDFIGFEALEPPTPAHRMSPRDLRRRRRELARRVAAAKR